MNYFDILLARKLNGGGGEITVEGLSVTENATYTAPTGKAYSPVVVNVPLPQNAHLLKSATSYPITPSLLPLPKAEVTFEGNKAELYVGSEPIVVAEDNTPYVYRQSPQNKSAVDLSIVGGTVAWNQLVQPVSGTWANVTFTANSDGSMSLGGSPNASYNAIMQIGIVKDHIYYERLVKISNPNNRQFSFSALNVSGLSTDKTKNDSEIIGKASNSINSTFGLLYMTANEDYSGIKIYVELVDLTQAFGNTIADYVYTLEQSTAGSGIAWLKSYGFLQKDYYAYDSGSLQSVNVASRKVVGFNQFDKSTATANSRWKSTGTDVATDTSRSQLIKCCPNTSYYFMNVHGSSQMAAVYWFDAGGNYISSDTVNGNSPQSGIIASPSNAYYVGINFPSTSLDSVCINISDTAKNGTYEPYTSTTYSFDSSKILRGIPKLSNGQMYYDGDVYNSDGTITRNYEERAYQSGDESLANAITDGTNTVYKLITPTTESATPFTNPQLAGSTEEFKDGATSRDVMIPCGQDSNYANSDIYISYGTSPIDMAKEHAIIPYASTYIDSNGSEDVEYWD